MSSSSSAATTTSTSIAPSMNVVAARKLTSSRSRGSADTVSIPERASRTSRAPGSGSRCAGRGSWGMRWISRAASTKSAAVAANASSALVAATSEPPSTAPTRKPALSIPLHAALEAASCSGVRASVGSSAACAGLIAVEAIVKAAASASTTANGAPAATAAATSARLAARRSVARTITSRRELRSASRLVIGAAKAAGSIRTSAATPTAEAPPTS